MGIKYLIAIAALSVLTNTTFSISAASGRPPVFTTQSKTTYVLPHSSLQLNCTADGWPFPTISWYRGGAPLTAFNGSLVSGSLMITSVTDGVDSSIAGVPYQCAASNSFGTILGTVIKMYTALLGAYQGPAMVTYIVKDTDANMDNVALYCNISGSNVPLTIVWLDELNNTVSSMEFSTSGHYITTFTTLNNSLYLAILNFDPILAATKTFHCAASYQSHSPLGTATLYNFSTSGYRNSDPFVYKPLEDVVLAYDGDGSVTFSLIAACIGFNLFFCQIYYVPPGSQLQRNDHLDSYGVNTLKGPVSVNDNGTVIQCWLTCGSFEEPRSIPYNSTLVVLVPPSLDPSPNNNFYYALHDSDSFSCVYHVSLEITLSWYKDGTALTNNSHTLISGPFLSIPSMLLTDSGMYQCSVSNGTTNVWRQWAVIVNLPFITMSPSTFISPIVANLRSNFTLIFQVLGNIIPSHIQWYVNGTAIQSSNVYQISNITRVTNSSENGTLYNASLLIRSVDFNKTQGFYYASFFTRVGIVNSSSIFITPPVPGQILGFTATIQCLSLGTTVQMTCAVYGYPIPMVIFLADNNLIFSNEHITIISNTLTLRNTRFSDAATYSCQMPSVQVATKSIQLPLCATLLASGPQGGTVTAGSSATILCTVSSYTSPTITISWYKDGLPFNSPNDGDQAIHTLVFPSVKLEDSGIYACSGGGAISNNFTLSVSPVISQELIIGLSVGGSAALSLLLLVFMMVVISAWHICRVKDTDLVPLIQVFVSPLTSSDAHSREETS